MEANNKLSRRAFLQFAALGAAGAALAACQPAAPAPTAKPEATSAPSGVEATPVPEATEAPVAAPTGPVTIRYTHVADPGELEIRQAEIADFEGKNPNIKVVAELVPEDGMEERIVTMVAGGAAPDTCYIHPSFVPLFSTQGVLLPLDDYSAKDPDFNPGDFYEKIQAHFAYNGKTYAYSYYSGPMVCYYNKTLFDQAGEAYPTTYAEGYKDGTDSWTWDKMLEVAQRLTKGEGDQRVFGVVPVWESLHALDHVIWSFGGEMWDLDAKKCLLSEPKAVEAIQYQADLYIKYNVAPTPQQAEGLPSGFDSGRIGMNTGGIRADVPALATVAFEVGLAPVPKGAAGRVTRDGPNGCGILASSKFADATWEFVKYMAGPATGDPGGMKFEFGMHRALPPRKSLYENQDFIDGLLPWEDLEVYRNSSESVRAIVLPARYSEIGSVWSEHWEAILAGTSTVQEAMNDACSQIDELLA